MSLILGQRIPSPYYEYVANRSVAVYYMRVCDSCDFSYPTAEVPLLQTWMQQHATSAECCPIHHGPGKLVMKVDPTTAVARGKWDSPGLLRAISFGGVYRRRQCKVAACLQTTGKWAGKGFRWTTIEVSADGIIVDDVTICPKCGGRGKIKRRTAKQLFTRGFWARYYALKSRGETPLVAMALRNARLSNLPIGVKDGVYVLLRDDLVPEGPAVPRVSEVGDGEGVVAVPDDGETFDDEGESDLVTPEEPGSLGEP